MDLKLPRLNRVIISGRLCRDPELRYTSSNSAVMSLCVAVDDGYFDKQSNQWIDRAIFMNGSVWGLQAEKLKNSLRKGSAVIVEGRLKQNSYTTQDGQNRVTIEFVADKIQNLDHVNRSNYNQNQNYNEGNNPQQNQMNNHPQNQGSQGISNNDSRPQPDFINDDVPF